MSKRIVVIVPTVLLCFAAVALAKEVAGRWHSEFDSQIGEQKYVFEFKVDGDKLTGKAIGEVKGEKRETNITDGKVKGDDISFTELLKFNDMEIKIEYKGKIKGDEIKLNRKVGDFADYDIVLKRVKDEPKKAGK